MDIPIIVPNVRCPALRYPALAVHNFPILERVMPSCFTSPMTRTPYRLYIARLDLHVSVLVYPTSSRVVPALPHVEAAAAAAAPLAPQPPPYSLAVGGGVVVPLSEAVPLQVTWCLLRASSVALSLPLILLEACAPGVCARSGETCTRWTSTARLSTTQPCTCLH